MSTNPRSIVERLDDAVDEIYAQDDGEDLSGIHDVVRQIIDDLDNLPSLEEADRDALLKILNSWQNDSSDILPELRTELAGKIALQQPTAEANDTTKRKATSDDSGPAKRQKAAPKLSVTGPDFGEYVAKNSRESAVGKQIQADSVNPETAISHDFHSKMLRSLAQITLQIHTKIREHDTRQFQNRIDAGQVKHLPPGTKLGDLEQLPQAMSHRNLPRRRKTDDEGKGGGGMERGLSKQKSTGNASETASRKAKAKDQEGDAIEDTAGVTDMPKSDPPSSVQPADNSDLAKYGLSTSDADAKYVEWLLKHASTTTGAKFTYKTHFINAFNAKAFSSIEKATWLPEVKKDCEEKFKTKAGKEAKRKTPTYSKTKTGKEAKRKASTHSKQKAGKKAKREAHTYNARPTRSKKAKTDQMPDQPLIQGDSDKSMVVDSDQE